MTLLTLSGAVSLGFMVTKTPLMMALLIVAQTITVAISIYTFLSTSWLSFIMFMILVSAMMVIFVYVSSLASNDFFVFSRPTLTSALYFTPLLMLLAYLTLNKREKSTKSQLALSDMDLGPMVPYKMYISYTSLFTLFLITYLLVALIVVAKISMGPKGALRALNP